MEENKSKVYVLVDEENRVTRCDGGYTIGNCQVTIDTGEVDQWGRAITRKEMAPGWVLIDEGNGDRYNLCQSHYFPDGLYTMDGICRYKLVDGEAVERSAEEMEADRAAVPVPEPVKPIEERVGTLEGDRAEMKEALELILSGVTE